MKVVSLFSGAGGLDLGFQMAGHDIVWANDMYEDAVQTYRSNLGCHIFLENIFEIESAAIPECDIVIGGFPCQGFSVANVKRSIEDERNQLYRQLVRVVGDKKPRFFVAENVKGLLNLAGGEILKMILSDFIDIGYNVQVKLLNSADFGVPQHRHRVFFVGVRNDVDFPFQFPAATHNVDGYGGLLPWVSVGEALAAIPDPDKPHNLTNHDYSKYKLRFNGYLGHRLVDPSKPAPTITARGDDKGGVVVLHHPNNLRRMSCRELATVQSFPIHFTFCGSRSSVYRQIGNAVPPLLSFAVANQFNR
jgi:DNA (cytosine-5)-methyltransferase 1